MTLSLITFSEYSESFDAQIPQVQSSFSDKNQSIKSNQRPRHTHIPLVRSVIHKIDIGSEKSNLAINSCSKANFQTKLSQQPNNFSNEKKFTYKNGRKIYISKPNVSQENASFKKSIKINPRLIQFSFDSDESESYYSEYSYSQYYSETIQKEEGTNNSHDNTNTNLPALKCLNDQTTNEKNDKSNISSNLNTNNDTTTDSNQQLPIRNILLDKYIVERKKKGISIIGKSMKYTLNKIEGSKTIPYIEAIATGTKVSIIDIKTREILGSIKTKRSHSHFLIRRNCSNYYNKVIMEIIYTSYNNIKPRSSILKIYEPIFSSNNESPNTNNQQNSTTNNEIHNENDTDINPNRLHSRNPKRGVFGMWSLDFGSRKIISSIKNSIIVDDNDNEYVVIGKVSDDSLSVEVANGMDPICALGIAVSTYMNTKP